MHRPQRPGEMVRDMIDELGITVTDAARYLNVTRQAMNNLINKNARVSPEMALRLETVFGGTAGNWLRMQSAYDEAEVRKRAAKVTKGLKRYQEEAHRIYTNGH